MAEVPKRGDDAPPLRVELPGGDVLEIADFRGEALVLVFLRHLQ